MTGQTLGHFRVLEKLGEGGMGEVYLAEDTTLKRRVALKVLPTELASSSERLGRFRREAESLAALNHPNIVHVYSVEEDQSTHFLTMELVDGDTLDQEVPPQGLPLERFFDLAIPLSDALSDAHEQGIVHRDLKPANIMVDRKGRPKILDFGLAKLRLPESSDDLSQLPTEVMTQEGRVLGTYPYMSPEQVEGKPVDHRSDLFSLGTVLYEMATGQRPFAGDSPASLMSAILRDSPSEVDAERPELPHHLGRIIGRCLEKEAENRYQRAKDLKRDLEELQQEVQSGLAPASRSVARPAARWRWALRAGLGILALLVVGVVLYMTRSSGTTAPPDTEPRITSLAVLPLANLSGDPEQDYYAAGITEGLIADLGRISALRVISRQSVVRYRDSQKSIPEIAEELGVEALIEGSVLPAGDRVRVSAQLVQASPERQLWAETYERDAKDILALLSEVTRAITTEVRVAVSSEEEALLARTREVDPEAHRMYLQGRYYFGSLVPEDVSKAGEYFSQAVEIDPTYAPAWAGLASYHLALEFWLLPYKANDLRAAAASQGDEALNRALALDESLSGAHSLKGSVEFYRNWDWQKAESEYRRAIELEPNSSEAHIWLAFFLAAMGRQAEATREAELARQLDPFSPMVVRLQGDIYYYAGDYEQSVGSYERALELSPDNLWVFAQIGFPLAMLGKDDEAVRSWQRFRRLLGQEEIASAYEGLGVQEVCEIYLEMTPEESSASAGGSPSLMAWFCVCAGDYEVAMDWLERGYAVRADRGETAGHGFPFMKVEPFFEPLHSDPRFQDLLRRMNLAD